MTICVEEKPRLNRRQTAKARTIEKVLERARELFLEKGYVQTTVRDIAKGIGMSTGAVFANFENKAELFIAVAGPYIRERQRLADDAAAKTGTARERIHAVSAVDYRFFAGNVRLASLMAGPWHDEPKLARYFSTAKHTLIASIEQAIEQGMHADEFPPVLDTQLLAEMIWSVHEGNYEYVLMGGWDESQLGIRFGMQLAMLLPRA